MKKLNWPVCLLFENQQRTSDSGWIKVLFEKGELEMNVRGTRVALSRVNVLRQRNEPRLTSRHGNPLNISVNEIRVGLCYEKTRSFGNSNLTCSSLMSGWPRAEPFARAEKFISANAWYLVDDIKLMKNTSCIEGGKIREIIFSLFRSCRLSKMEYLTKM